jgi:hypothetical protein
LATDVGGRQASQIFFVILARDKGVSTRVALASGFHFHAAKLDRGGKKYRACVLGVLGVLGVLVVAHEARLARLVGRVARTSDVGHDFLEALARHCDETRAHRHNTRVPRHSRGDSHGTGKLRDRWGLAPGNRNFDLFPHTDEFLGFVTALGVVVAALSVQANWLEKTWHKNRNARRERTSTAVQSMVSCSQYKPLTQCCCRRCSAQVSRAKETGNNIIDAHEP